MESCQVYDKENPDLRGQEVVKQVAAVAHFVSIAGGGWMPFIENGTYP